MQLLRIGTKDPLVVKWLTFLRGSDQFHGEVTDTFDDEASHATMRFQANSGLFPVDGIVGNDTWGAAMARGFQVLPPASPATDIPPTTLQPITAAERAALFGTFEFVPAPVASNPEAITITTRSPDYRLANVTPPQLIGVLGAPAGGKILIHEKLVDPITALFKAWDDAGLRNRILAWAGSYSPRFIRGSRTVLSNHAWGTAFDINAAWNPLGVRPALFGQRGCVRELVAIAEEHGFYWGGRFTRTDGMHFEAMRVG